MNDKTDGKGDLNWQDFENIFKAGMNLQIIVTFVYFCADKGKAEFFEKLGKLISETKSAFSEYYKRQARSTAQ